LDALRLVLVETEGSVNLGMIARLCENFDVDELVLVKPKASIEEARRYAARAAHRLDEARIVESMGEALEGASLSVCTSAKHSTGRAARIPLEAREAAARMAAEPGTVALVMGRESVGLTLAELEHCDLLATIPSSPRYPELNLANATAIMLYEVYLARRKPSLVEYAEPTTRRLLEAYSRALAKLTISDEQKQGETVLALRRLASHAEAREAALLLYLISRACTRIPGCQDEVRRHLQSGPRGPPGEGGTRGGTRGEDNLV